MKQNQAKNWRLQASCAPLLWQAAPFPSQSLAASAHRCGHMVNILYAVFLGPL